MSEQVKQHFTSIAPTYDFLNHLLSLSIDRSWRKKALSLLPNQNMDRILDLCAGTLDLTIALKGLFPRAQIYSIDFSIAMLEKGKLKLKSKESNPIICGDGHQLPIAGQSMNSVICGFGIRNLEKRNQALSEIWRILTPGGYLLILDFFKPASIFSKFFHLTYGNLIIPFLGGIISKNRQAYQYLQSSINEFFTVEEYCHLLTKQGFVIKNKQALSGGIAHLLLAKKYND